MVQSTQAHHRTYRNPPQTPPPPPPPPPSPLACASPVPGGRSTMSTCRSFHAVPRAILSSADDTIGPLHTAARSGLTSRPTLTQATPCAKMGTMRFCARQHKHHPW